MYHFFIASLCVFFLTSPGLTSLTASLHNTTTQNGTTLYPISIVDYEPSTGLQRRVLNDLSGIDPQNHTHLMYGSLKGETSGSFHSLYEDNKRQIMANSSLPI